MPQWIRFADGGAAGFGILDGSSIRVHAGNLYDSPQATGRTVALDAVEVLTPTVPSKMIAMWNNFRALAAKLGNPVPAEPLYLLKASNSFLAAGGTIRCAEGRTPRQGGLRG